MSSSNVAVGFGGVLATPALAAPSHIARSKQLASRVYSFSSTVPSKVP